ncbi:metallophosphoesterase family protein [Corynebacterium incognita]|uniref:Metallophosphoesterase family protein n=1 Tax=Corynebacterium incognita TaxID=2754725 RepID=A0A7G7CR12_9CORY|nr:metallophosphoesterase family protein [Corynebacterium incognita]QNE90028.1 metallophosphoesterase family protein [Corynebacterium incognita]
MQKRFVTALTASITAVSLTFTSVPALAQESDPVSYVDIPGVTDETGIQNIVFGVGADETEANLSWLTEKDVTGQSVQFGVAGEVTADNIATAGTTVATDSTNADISVSYDYDGTETGKFSSHKAVITGLEENTSYVYRVGSDATGWSELQEFSTKSFGDEWNFLAVGDPQLGSGGNIGYEGTPDERTEADATAWANNLDQVFAELPDTSYILSGGDQTNKSNKQEHNGFTSAEQLQQYRLAPNNGNHDDVDLASYNAFYNRPNLSADGHNYFYEYNNSLVVSLDSNHWWDYENDKQFVRDAIEKAGSDKDWIIVTFHHALFSQAYHQEDTNVMAMRDEMTRFYSEMGVDLVISGHDHIHTRSHLMDGNRPVVSEAENKVGEVLHPEEGQVQYLTLNSASGSKFYNFYDPAVGDRPEDYTYEQSKADGSMRYWTALWDQNFSPDYTNIEVSGDELKVTTKDFNGDLVDEFTLAKGASDGGSSDGSSDGSSGGSSTGSAGWLTPVLMLVAFLGGAALSQFANFKIPGVDLKKLAQQHGIKF